MAPSCRFKRALVVLGALVAAALVVAIASPTTGDYIPRDAQNADNSAPVLDALIEGDLGRAVEVQPIVGPVTVLLRWPFAALGRALGGLQLEYELGATACLWVLALLAAGLAWRAGRLSRERLTAPVVFLLLVANPVTLATLDAGHPEDIVAAALATAAVLLAGRGRPVASGLVLALAVGAKPWAALAAPVALLVLDRGHARTILAGALAALLILAPPFLSNPERMREGSRVLTEQPRVYAPSAWWPLSHEKPVTHTADPSVPVPSVMPGGLTRSAGQTAIVLLTLAVALAYVRRRRDFGIEAGLSVLAGLMLARAALDPINLYYYGLPFVVALVAWETYARRGVPVVSVVASAALWATVSPANPSNPDLACALFLAWSVPAAAWLTLAPLRAAVPKTALRRSGLGKPAAG
jgi:hypothetical protein